MPAEKPHPSWPVAMHVEVGKVAELARALRATHPSYLALDRIADTPLVAPATFPVVLNHWGVSGRDILEALGCRVERVLHGEESYEYVKGPFRSGQQLTGEVEVLGKETKHGRSSGPMTLWRLRTTLRDERTNETAVTAIRTIIELGD